MNLMCAGIEETIAFGWRLGCLAPVGFCITLSGPLGAGKTHLVRGIAKGARVADANLVSSPTYVLLNIYPRNPADAKSKTIYHLDAYRAHGAEDFAAIDLDELLSAHETPAEDGLVVIEWPQRIADLLPADRLDITIDPVDEMIRDLALTATGPRADVFLRRIAGR